MEYTKEKERRLGVTDRSAVSSVSRGSLQMQPGRGDWAVHNPVEGIGMGIGQRSSVQPVAIGGVGGSGTRLVAEILRHLGYYMGRDLNEASDNLWFTLLFRRTELLNATRTQKEFTQAV